MKILVAIDDTDNIDIKRGTGHLASMLADELEVKGWAVCEAVTRHQLFVHPDVPYTSHNSAMCFTAETEPNFLDRIIEYGGEFLAREQAVGSDPGLCVAVIDRLVQPGWLVAFGYSAKQEVLTKEYAYSLAEELDIHLSEHGGTGMGVIGALAGAGLRLGGNDGRFRGKLSIKSENEIASVGEIRANSRIEMVRSLQEGYILGETEMVRLGEMVKPVLLGGKAVLLVVPQLHNGGAAWTTLSKNQTKAY